MKKHEINTILAPVAGFTVSSEYEGEIFGYKKNPGENVTTVEGLIDFTRDWNLLMPLAIKHGLFPGLMELEDPMAAVSITLAHKLKQNGLQLIEDSVE
jgi:hypothetical protein